MAYGTELSESSQLTRAKKKSTTEWFDRLVTLWWLPQWLGVLYLGLACSVFAFLVQTWAIQQTSASRASLLMGTEPIWAVLIGLSIGQDTLSLPGILGAALIVAGTYLGLRAETRHRVRLRRNRPRQGRFQIGEPGGTG
ncbi:DMT family transporter [Arthrobacter citreus]|uniref:DMT family transporter n=1 Tax=Arthrobacter citreus TaxID=1670 RepID=UPI003818802D